MSGDGRGECKSCAVLENLLGSLDLMARMLGSMILRLLTLFESVKCVADVLYLSSQNSGSALCKLQHCGPTFTSASLQSHPPR